MQSHAEKFNWIWNWNLMLFLLHAIPEQRERTHWDKSFYKVAFCIYVILFVTDMILHFDRLWTREPGQSPLLLFSYSSSLYSNELPLLVASNYPFLFIWVMGSLPRLKIGVTCAGIKSWILCMQTWHPNHLTLPSMYVLYCFIFENVALLCCVCSDLK